MERKKAEAVLEAVLFTMGESVELGRLAAVLEMEQKEVRQILEEMQKRYEEEDRGIFLLWLGGQRAAFHQSGNVRVSD